jgi:hypothetical protein
MCSIFLRLFFLAIFIQLISINSYGSDSEDSRSGGGLETLGAVEQESSEDDGEQEEVASHSSEEEITEDSSEEETDDRYYETVVDFIKSQKVGNNNRILSYLIEKDVATYVDAGDFPDIFQLINEIISFGYSRELYQRQVKKFVEEYKSLILKTIEKYSELHHLRVLEYDKPSTACAVISTPCSHEIHRGCLREHVRRGGARCPTCRCDISSFSEGKKARDRLFPFVPVQRRVEDKCPICLEAMKPEKKSGKRKFSEMY